MSRSSKLSPASSEQAALRAHYRTLRGVHMRDLFAQEKNRFERFHIAIDGLVFDFSRYQKD